MYTGNLATKRVRINYNKSSPSSFGKSASLRLIAENALVRCMC